MTVHGCFVWKSRKMVDVTCLRFVCIIHSIQKCTQKFGKSLIRNPFLSTGCVCVGQHLFSKYFWLYSQIEVSFLLLRYNIEMVIFNICKLAPNTNLIMFCIRSKIRTYTRTLNGFTLLFWRMTEASLLVWKRIQMKWFWWLCFNLWSQPMCCTHCVQTVYCWKKFKCQQEQRTQN